MQCHEVQRQLPAYLARESNLDYIGIKNHLKGCPECARALEAEKALNSLLDDWEAPALSIDFSQQIMAQLTVEDSNRKPKNRPFSLLQDILASAAAVMIVVTSAYSIAEKTPVPNYSSKLDVISQSIGSLSDSYVNLSAHTVNRVVKSVEQWNFFAKGDEK